MKTQRRPMSTIGEYRGCAVHAFQDEARVRGVIMPEVDAVHALADREEAEALIRWAGDASRAPESRLRAARLLLEPAAAAAAQRQKVKLDRDFMKACVAGLGKLETAREDCYQAIFHPPTPPHLPQPAPRPAVHAEALRTAKAAAR